MLQSIITSKTRLNLLIKFFVNIANKGYLNSLATEFGESTNSVRKELNNLTDAGILVKKSSNNKIIYSANKNHPLFDILQSTIRKHLGIEGIVSSIVEKIGDINKIILIGDYAKGIDSGLIELVIIGKNIDINFLDEIRPKIERKIKRKIDFFVSTSTYKNEGLVVFEG